MTINQFVFAIFKVPFMKNYGAILLLVGCNKIERLAGYKTPI
tara:strand:- start:4586 stop:4711 length:126 start_codon:yes stop_codon:yes gene_type:complete